jgi:hypothetical protein
VTPEAFGIIASSEQVMASFKPSFWIEEFGIATKQDRSNDSTDGERWMALRWKGMNNSMDWPVITPSFSCPQDTPLVP